jgi:DNA-binding NarL/FixJ family response regulator
MSRRARVPAEALLDLLATGKRVKEIAREHHLEPNSICSVLMFERRRCNAKTNMQLLAIHLKKKMDAK